MINRTVRKSLIALQFILLSVAATAELKISSMNPNLAVTAQQQLGTREDNIGLSVGATVPDFSVNTHDNKAASLKDIQSMGDTLVVFYRGGWGPFCNMQVRELATNYDKLKAAGVQPILISVDEPDKSAAPG